jgi:EpsI family protein
MKPSAGLRFVLAAALIVLTAILLQARGRNEVFPPRLPLQSFPLQLGPWTGIERPIGRDVLEVLGPGEFIVRDYSAPNNLDTNLYIAYFPSQRAGDTIHSPQNCLPGAGWNPDENVRVPLTLPGHAPFPANRYVISKGNEHRLVLYWYWAHDRGVASEYWAKYYLVKDSIRMNRSDGALVRIMTDMSPGETADAAQQRLLPFSREVGPLLDNYIPR